MRRLQSVSFAPYRPGQSPLTRTFPTPDQIEQDLKRLQGKVRSVRTYSAGENLEAVPQRAGKYGLKVWHGAWLNDNDKENLEQINLLIDHANRYPDTIERVIVGNEVLLRKDLTGEPAARLHPPGEEPGEAAGDLCRRLGILAAQSRRWPTRSTSSPSTCCPIGRTSRSASIAASPTARCASRTTLLDIFKKVQERFPDKKIVIGETGWPSDGRMRSDARPGRVEQVRYFSIFRSLAEREHFDYNIVEAFDQYWKARQEGTVGAAWGLLDAQRNDKFQLGQPVSAEPHWRMLFTLSTMLVGRAVLVAFASSMRRQAAASAIAIFAVFAQLVATCYVQAIWIDLSRTFYFEKMVGVVFWALLLGALQLRPAARHRRQPDRHGWPTRRSTARGCAKPGAPGASCRATASCSAPT